MLEDKVLHIYFQLKGLYGLAGHNLHQVYSYNLHPVWMMEEKKSLGCGCEMILMLETMIQTSH